MNILVTGATGLIGTSLLACLKETEHEVLCQSRKNQKISSDFKWIEHDLLNDDWNVLEPGSIDVVYFLAGQTSVYAAAADPKSDLEANVCGLLNLLDHFKEWEKLPFIVYTGTATEVGLTNNLPITEKETDKPVTFYDLSKLTAENYLKQYISEGFARGCVLRLANVFGRYQPSQKKDRGILDKIYNRALAGEPISVFGDGAYLRDYIFIDDVVSALLLAAEHQDNVNGQHYNLGTGVGVSLKEAFEKVVGMAVKRTGIEVPINHVPAPENLSSIEFRNAIFDTTAFKNATGWSPKYNFDQALIEAYSDL